MEGNRATLEAVDRAIPVLKEQGYEFVNLPQLFEKCGVDPCVPNALWSVVDSQIKGNVWQQP